jgi:hypothetical protein
MKNALLFLVAFSGLSFVFYGVLCLFSSHMEAEFKRYGLPQFRRLVGCLELLGGMGVLLGLLWNPLMVFSASGLAVLMLLGVAVRIRVKDAPLQIAPAAVLMLVNSAIVWLNL